MVMDREKLTAGAFAESIGVAQATISHILGPRNKYPSTEVILRLHQRYNDINLEWLLTGKGNMSNNPDSPENDGFDYPLFAENPENLSNGPEESKNRKEIALETALKSPKEIVKQEIIYKERPPRKRDFQTGRLRNENGNRLTPRHKKETGSFYSALGLHYLCTRKKNIPLYRYEKVYFRSDSDREPPLACQLRVVEADFSIPTSGNASGTICRDSRGRLAYHFFAPPHLHQLCR